AQAQPDRIDSITQPPVSSLTQYWTSQRLRDAAPMPLPVVDPRTGGSVSPDNAPPQAALPDRPDAALPSAVNGNVSTRPPYWAGKIFFARSDGSGGYCSTQFIAPGLLLMAAHCVRDEKSGAWFTNFLYIHGYDHGKGRRFGTQCASAYDGWIA